MTATTPLPCTTLPSRTGSADLSATLDTAYDAIETTNFGTRDWTGSENWETKFDAAETEYKVENPEEGNRGEFLESFIDEIAPGFSEEQKQALLEAATALTVEEKGNKISMKDVAANIVDILEAGDKDGDSNGDRGLRIEDGDRATDVFYVRDNTGSGSMQPLETPEQVVVPETWLR